MSLLEKLRGKVWRYRGGNHRFSCSLTPGQEGRLRLRIKKPKNVEDPLQRVLDERKAAIKAEDKDIERYL
jgi:hypothetical protein